MQRIARSQAACVFAPVLPLFVLALICPATLPTARAATESMRAQVEADWIKQAEAWKASLNSPLVFSGNVSTKDDAAGAVDGIRNGKYAFHTGADPNPWWQVDLGEPAPLGRLVVYNRLDYAPGLHNADRLLVLVSDDGKAWKQAYDNQGKHFGGISGAPPLEVRFQPGQLRARFVRLQISSPVPILFHLDEVEVYGFADPQKNLALHRPADQSSTSQWSTMKLLRPLQAGPASAYPIRYFVERGRLLAADLRRAGADARAHETELDALAAQAGKLPDNATDSLQKEMYFKVRWVVRQLAFANPLLRFDQLLLVKRFTQQTYPDICLNHMPWVSPPGGDLCILTLAGPDRPPEVRNLLNGALGPGHVHGMDLWWDATRVVFGYAKAKSNEPPAGWLDRRTSYVLRRTEEPTHLFEIGIDGKGLRQLTSGQWSDLDPTYLANGNIAFASERCAYSLQCNEPDKDETSCNIYVVGPGGKNIRRLSVTKDGDYLPHALDDGTIAYTRWEYEQRLWANIQSIWTVRPDGTGADAIFKQHFNDPWALEDTRSIPGSKRLVSIATGHHTLPAGPLTVVNPHVGINNPEGIRIVTPGVLPPEGGMSGNAVPEGGVMGIGGFYMTPWPLSEKHFLASYAYCDGRTCGPASEVDPAGYALYLVDVYGTKELIYRDPAISCFTPIPLRARARPPILPDMTDPGKPYAVCAVSNVTRGCDGIAPSQARYLRISEGIPWPYCNQYGGQRYEPDVKGIMINWNPVRIIGTVPIEADGSAQFQVPVDTPVYFQLLDENQMELRRMRSFISFQPGEQRACSGCHESQAITPPARNVLPLALSREPSIPKPPPWGDRAISFLRDVQPVLDRHCASCHSGLKPAGRLDFSGGLTARYNRAYDTILEAKLVARSNVGDDSKVTPPLAFGSHKSKLVAVLGDALHQREVKLTAEDRLRLVTWIDSNGPYHDGFINVRPEKPPYDLPGDGDLARQIAAVHSRRCASCHQASDVSRLDWIDLRRPRQSLFLAAPLAKEATGKGKCKETVYKNQADPDYRAVLAMVEAATAKAWAFPRRDLQAIDQKEASIAKRGHH